MKISGLRIYPIKSCAGIELNEVTFNSRGFLFDREWMFINAAGRFLSQRDHSKLSSVQTEIKANQLIVSFAGEEFVLPLDAQIGPDRLIKLWKTEFQAYLIDSKINQAMSAFLGEPVQLVRYSEKFPRLEKQSRFADGGTVHLITEESFAVLSQMYGRQLMIDRFRANIIVKGSPAAWVEEQWEKIKLGSFDFNFTRTTSRCGVINIDQQVGSVLSPHLFKSLAEFRMGQSSISFGIYLNGPELGHLKVNEPAQCL